MIIIIRADIVWSPPSRYLVDFNYIITHLYKVIIQTSYKFSQERQGFAHQTINEPICVTLYYDVIA